jgi:hypothetical protein
MTAIALAKLDSNERVLNARLPECWDGLPACAQLALHSLAWACGANCHFPRLFQAVTDRDFGLAAIQIRMNEWTPEGIHNVGIVPRNLANERLMRNAAYIDELNLDLELLDWTHDLRVGSATTLTELDDPASNPTSSASSPTIYVLSDDGESGPVLSIQHPPNQGDTGEGDDGDR